MLNHRVEEESLENLLPSGSEDNQEIEQILRPYGIGVDCHSRFYAICVLVRQEDRVVRHQREAGVSYCELLEAKQWAQLLLKKTGVNCEPLLYTCESTGPYHQPLIKAWGGAPSIVNPLLANPSRRKTDKLDARLLARHAITGLWPLSYLATQELMVLRMLMRARNNAKKQALRLSNQILNIMTTAGYPVSLYGSPRSPKCRGIIEDLIGGQAMERKEMPPFPFPPEVGQVVRSCYNDFDMAVAEQKAYEFKARQWVKENRFPAGTADQPCQVDGATLLKLLKTVPGIGDISALVWMSEVGTPARFFSAKAVSAFAGCDPSVKVSAGKVTSHTRRGGNKRLHYTVFHAAMSLMSNATEPVGKWGVRLAGRGIKGAYRKAAGAVARRIVCGLYYVHSKLEPFSYEKYTFEKLYDVKDTELAELGLKKRTIAILEKLGITRTTQLIDAAKSGLHRLEGVGPKTLQEVNEWLGSVEVK
jgi:transposase